MRTWHKTVSLILADNDANEEWIADLEAHGCVSGMVGGLVCYAETVGVYEDHEDEILEILDDAGYVDPPGLVSLRLIANARVWAAFELTAPGVFEDASAP